MNSKLCYSVVLGTALLLTGCGKKMNQFKADYFTVNPNPLEVVGDKVPATVTGNIPGKFFVKNAEVTVTPYLEFGGMEVASAPYTFQGEKVRGNNPVVNFENGGTVTIPVQYVYNPDMRTSELSLAFTVKQGSKQYALPRVKVANGVVATAALADVGTVNPAIAPDKFQRVINEKYDADIKFLINQANIRDGQLRSAEMQNLHKELVEANDDGRREIKEINVTSYASPDGGVKLNTRLAENREKNTVNYMEGKLKKDHISNFGELTADFTPQDWEGFKKLVSASNIQDKELILSVLAMYKDPEQREREIKNLSSVFDQLAEEILPQLRYSRITASIDVIGKSDEEIKNIYKVNPKGLTVDEILYAATLTDDNEQRIQIYDTAASLYPNDSTIISITGQNVQNGVAENVNVSSKELYDTVVEFVRKYVKIIQSLISGVPNELAGSVKSEGVILCGGGARLAGLDMFLNKELGIPVRVASYPEDVSILGMIEYNK